MSPPAYRPTSPPIVVPAASGEHSSTLIMLHGLGDTGEGWAFLAERLRPLLPHTEFIFPHAPLVRRRLAQPPCPSVPACV